MADDFFTRPLPHKRSVYDGVKTCIILGGFMVFFRQQLKSNSSRIEPICTIFTGGKTQFFFLQILDVNLYNFDAQTVPNKCSVNFRKIVLSSNLKTSFPKKNLAVYLNTLYNPVGVKWLEKLKDDKKS